jgi:hypothetical protein
MITMSPPPFLLPIAVLALRQEKPLNDAFLPGSSNQ